MLAAPVVYDQKVYFTTYTPNTIPCDQNGTATTIYRQLYNRSRENTVAPDRRQIGYRHTLRGGYFH